MNFVEETGPGTGTGTSVEQDRSAPPDGGTVLIVDDESAVRDFVVRALSRAGYECWTAASADEAIASLTESLPDLLITDVRMPGADGIWLLGQVKSRWPEVPVVMLTAVVDARTAVKCLKDGAADYLTKPLDLDELFIATRRTVDFARLCRENREFRDDLESMRAHSRELSSTFHVIETTYREALGALTNHPGDHAPARTMRTSAGAIDGSAPQELSPELLALHAGAGLIADGASFVELASSLGRELVEGGAAAALGVWRYGDARRGIELASGAGARVAETRELAVRALSSGTTHRVERDGSVWVATPVHTAGVIEAVLVVVWDIQDAGEPVDATERLALYLATSIKLERDARERKRTAEELELFQKLAIASRYSLDLQSVAHFLLDSLHRVVDYEAAGLLLLEEHQSLRIQTRSTTDPRFIEQIRSHVLNTLQITCGVEPGAELDVRVRHLPSASYPSEGDRKLRSFVDVPLTVGEGVTGLIHVSSSRERAFSPQDSMFLHRAAHFLASSVQGVRDLLAAVKSRVEQMVEHMTDGVLMLDGKGDVVAMNRAARLQLRIDGESERRPDLTELARTLDFDPLALVQKEQHSSRRVVCIHGIPYQVQLSPVFDNEELVGAVVAFRNFTEEQRIDTMKTEFINVVSHELRTPLTAIKNAVAILQGSRLGELTEGQNRFVGLAKRNVDQLISIINDLLDLSKIESGHMRIELRPTGPAEPIEAAVIALQPRAEEAGVTLESRIEADLPSIYADAPSLQRVLTNLVGNAIKFTKAEGKVSVEAVAVSDELGDPWLRVSVTDTGAGIPKDELETIFEKFHQVERARAMEVVGTGLGLPITRELVKAHHGRIRVESELGEGSRFIVDLPVLSEDKFFFVELDQELDRARQQQSPLVLVRLALDERERWLERLGRKPFERLFETLLEAAGEALHRSTDRVLARKDLGELTVVLPKTDARGGAIFESRLREKLNDTALAEMEVKLSRGIAQFPVDGRTSSELYRATMAAASAEKMAIQPA